MAKKDKKSTSRKARDEDLDDNMSDTSLTISDSIEGSDEEENEKDWEDKLLDAIDGLTEKRATTRLSNLQTVYDIMSEKHAKAALKGRIDTLTHGVITCVQRGTSDKECILGIETLSLITITVGSPQGAKPIRGSDDSLHLSDELRQRVRELLTLKCVEGKSNDANQNVRHAAVMALAIVAFVEDDGREVASEMGMCKKFEDTYMSKEPDMSILAQAITGWTLMASITPTHIQASSLLQRIKPRLIKCLNKGDLNVKIACGEALALLYEAVHKDLRHAEDEGEFSDEEILKETDDEWMAQLNQLSTQTTKQVAKKDRSVQKSSFRDIIETIEQGTRPQVKFIVKKTTLTFDDWRSIVQYNALRTVLGSGLIHHVSDNEFVRDVFNVSDVVFDEKSARKLNKDQKQALLSKKSHHKKMDTIDKAMRTRSSHDLTIFDTSYD
ncbi:interferon-related protein [Acrasis kona]|uniref:Interferon-related protein n=1 Tax=Acrasis kona TaxID=1008807 RepID=A0AAW2YTV3_9EUKA